jgi:hypothetical protein
MKIFSVSYQVVEMPVDHQTGRRGPLQRVTVVAVDSDELAVVIASNLELEAGERVEITAVQHEHPGRPVLLLPPGVVIVPEDATFEALKNTLAVEPFTVDLNSIPIQTVEDLENEEVPAWRIKEPVTVMAEITAPEHGE